MPDVLEDVSTRGGCERDLFFRESQELEEKLLANTSGRKFLPSDPTYGLKSDRENSSY